MQQYAQPRPWILVSATYASSAMPQKRNPGPLIDIRRDAAVVLSELNSVVMRTHNLPTGMYDAKDEKLNREIVGDASSVVEQPRLDGHSGTRRRSDAPLRDSVPRGSRLRESHGDGRPLRRLHAEDLPDREGQGHLCRALRRAQAGRS